MSDVNANIGIHFDTSDALAQLRQLQAGLSKFNQALTEGNVAAANAQKGLNAQLVQSINATGKFVASQKTIASSTSAFTDALEKNKLSMTQYFRYTGAAATQNSKVFANAFKQEKDILNRAMKDRVKSLQTQYIQLTNANGDLVKVLQVVPKHLKMINGQYADYATRTQMAAQRQQMLNQLIKQGSTQLLNFGKNTQWAGRQLMVGLTIPLTMLGGVASKAFKEMEEAVIKFQRVYGDMTTTVSDTDKAVKGIQLLAKEFTKYGIAAAETVRMASDAAAMGLTGADLTAQVTEATKLAVLGQVEQQQALETTISLQNAFGVSADQLAQKINFLNAVENQTVLSIEDLTVAIPKAGPVVKQLGGSVEDLAFFMTAMKEGGINASEGANALKSGLASMINPSKKASEFLANLGININGLVEANKGDLKGTVVGFARALDTLDPLNRARAIEQLFGKFQFARLSTLFKNVTADSSQAARALGLAGASVEELAILSERELGKVENAVGVKFQKQLENIKLQLVPIGKAFLEAITPVVQFAGKILEKFNNLSEGTKKFVVGFIAILGGIAPVALMTVGLVANGVANLIKFFGMLRGGMAKLNGQNNVLGGGFDYLTQAEIDNIAQTEALHVSHSELISTFNIEKTSVDLLAQAYANAASQARALASGSPGLFNTSPGPQGAVSGLPKKFASGGVVPGTGNKDTVPAMLTPGEVVLSKQMVKDNPNLIAGIMSGKVKGYSQSTAAEGNGIPGASRGLADSIIGGVPASQFPGLNYRVTALAEGMMKNTPKTIERIIKYAADGGEEISKAQVEAIELWRFKALEAIQKGVDSAKESPKATTTSTEVAKKLLKDQSLTVDGNVVPGKNIYTRLDSHGSQNESSSYAHITPNKKMDSKGTLDALDPNSQEYAEVNAVKMAAEYLNNLPESDSRRPKKPIIPEYNVVSGLGLDKIPQGMNKDLDLGKQNIQEFSDELNKVAPLERWESLLKQNGLSTAEYGKEVEIVDNKLKSMISTLGQTQQTMGDTDLINMVDNIIQDPETSPTMKVALQKSKNKVTGARIARVGNENAKNIENVVRSGEVAVPGLKSPETFTVAKSGSAQVGDTDASRIKGIGTFDKDLDKILTRAEVDIAQTRSPSERTRKLGVNIGEGLRIGLEQKTKDVKSQADKLADASVPKVDIENQAKYNALKSDPYQRQIQKSIDRNNRNRFGVAPRVAQPTESTETSMTVDIDPQALVADISAAKAARKRAKELDKQASEAEAVAADLRIKAARWEAAASREDSLGNKNSYPRENADGLNKLAAEAELKAAQLRIKAAEERSKATVKSKKSGTLADAGKSAKAAAREAGKTKKAQEQATDATESVSAEQIRYKNEVRRAKNKAKKTADASGDVLVAETDVARNSAITATASQTQAQNTLTAAELTQATEVALGDSANNNQQIIDAEEDRLQSAEEIAKLEDDIEAQKRKLKEEGMRAVALQQQQNSIIPDGAQTSNSFVNPATAMGYEDAYNEAAEYTRDKNGQILFDPELGPNGEKNPTKLNKKQIAKKARGMRREKVSKYSGKAAGALGTATMVAGMVGAPPQVTAALGAASTVASFAPMLAGLGPVGATAAALAAVGASAYMVKKHFTAMAEAQAKFVRDTTISSEKLRAVGELNGKVGANELMNKRREGGLLQGYNDVERKGTDYGVKYLENAAGKTMQDALVKSINKSGAKNAAQEVALQLASQISDGVLTAEQAKSVAYQIGVNLKDASLTANIQGQLRMLVGPNGEDILKNPLTARMRLVQISENRTAAAKARVEKSQGESVGWSWMGFKKSGADEAAQLAALSTAQVEMAQLQADAVSVYVDKQKAILESQKAITTDKAKQLEIDKQLAELDAMNQTANRRVAASVTNAVTQTDGIITGQSTFESMANFDKGNNAVVDYLLGGPLTNMLFNQKGRVEGAYFDANKADIKAKYKGTAQEAAANRAIDTLSDADEDKSFKGDKVAGRQFEAKMQVMIGSGVLQPDQANSLLKMFSGNYKQLSTVLNVGLRTQGAAKMGELTGLLSGVNKKSAKTIMVSMVRKSPADFDKTAKTLALMQASDGLEINMDVFVKNLTEKELTDLSNQLDAIDKMKTPIEKDVVIKFGKDNNVDMSGIIDSWDYYGNMKPEVQKEAIQTYTMLSKFITEFDSPEARKTWAMNYAKQEALLMGEEGSAEYTQRYNTIYKVAVEGDVAGLADRLTQAKYGTNPNLAVASAAASKGPGDKKERDTTYDDIMKRLRNVRLAALNAAGGFKELEKAIAKSGSKAIGDQFRGLEQQLIRLGKTGQFTDYLAGLDQEELNKFGKAATKKGIDPNTGKKKKGVKVGDFILSDKGEKMEKGFNKAIIGDYNKSQLQSVTLNKQEIQARTKLLAMGFKEADVRTMLADENYRTLVATGKITKKELETNAALTQQARLRGQINSVVTAGRDKKEVAENQKRIPEVVKMLQMANVDAEGIRSAISDPDTLKTLIEGMDNFAALGQDAQNEFREVIDQINDIPDQKIIELVFTQTEAEKQIAGSQAAAELFDAYKMIDENTIKNAEGNTYAGLQVLMEDLNNQARVAQDQINITQSKIDTMQQEVDADQRKIESEITRPIEQKQRAIEKMSRNAELNFSRPISALQERSNILSHDLEVMNHAAEEINKKYDKQQEALQEVAKVNQQIIQQQQQQLGLADALSKGDISAAAKAVQEMRATNAGNFAQNSQEALQKARENEIKGLKGGVSGLTQEQIQEEQYQNGLKIYDLEQKKAAVDKAILVIQDEIYKLEQDRQVALDAIQVKTDAIAKIQFGELLTQQNKAKEINDQNLKYQLQLDKLALLIADNDRNRVIQGATRLEWDAMLKSAEAQEKLAKGDLAKALGVVGDISGKAATAWKSIKDAYDGILSKSVDITQRIRTIIVGPDGTTDTADTQTQGNGPVVGQTKYNGSQLETWDGSKWVPAASYKGPAGSNDSSGGNSNSGSGGGNGSSNGSGSGSSSSTQSGAGSVATSTPAVYSSADAAKAAADAKAYVQYTSADAAKAAADKKQADVTATRNNAGVLAQEAAAKAAADKEAKARAAALAKTNAGIAAQEAAKNAAAAKAAVQAKAAQAAVLKKFGGNATAASQFGNWSSGGLIPQYLASGGFAIGTDTVPAMLTPGEFIMSRYAVNTHGVDTLKAMNSGATAGDSVYNYNLSVNVRSDANPNDIARTVIAQIKQIDSQRIGGNRF